MIQLTYSVDFTYYGACKFVCQRHPVDSNFDSQAAITRCDLSAMILLKLVDSYLIAFKFAQ